MSYIIERRLPNGKVKTFTTREDQADAEACGHNMASRLESASDFVRVLDPMGRCLHTLYKSSVDISSST